MVMLQKHHELPASALSSTPLGDVVTSVLKRRRPKATLTLDPAPPGCSPPAAARPSRHSSASMDSGYGSGSVAASPTFPVVDFFAAAAAPRTAASGARTPGGPPLTAPPLPSSVSQTPRWFGQHCPPPAAAATGFWHRAPIVPPRPATTARLYGSCFVFDVPPIVRL